jgi:hypothetical protein
LLRHRFEPAICAHRKRFVRARPRIWLDVGTAEGGSAQQVLDDARLLRDALVERGWREGADLNYAEFSGAEHSEWAWGARFGQVLRYFFGKG